MMYLVILDCEQGVCKVYPIEKGYTAEDIAMNNGYDLEEHHWMECDEIKIYN